MGFLKKIAFLFLLFFVALTGYQVGVFTEQQKNLQKPPAVIINQDKEAISTVDFSIFWETWHQLENLFFEKEKLDPQKMVYGAIKGLVNSLEDPYTVFFTPEESKTFQEEMAGKYQGVGMVVGIKDDQLTVISPFKNTPADKAGLKPGDKILKIDNVPTNNMPIEKAVSLIKGQEGTTVDLLILRDGWKEPRTITIKRAVITIPTLEWELKKGGKIAVIRIYQFNGVLNNEFKKAAINILRSQAEGIILDLRNNPGGYLNVAQDIAGWFLNKGEVVVIQKGKNEEKTYKSKGPSNFANYPIVVLINNGSASGAEIVAGALRDQRGIKLVGERSFGKGSVQEQVPLSGGASLKVTIAKWYTPAGHQISEKGLIPDFEVKIPEDTKLGEDPQLEKAIEVLLEQISHK